jgi:hypothetical protein
MTNRSFAWLLALAADALSGTHISAQPSQTPPKVMHWCSQHCSTWVWVGNRYVGEEIPYPERSPQCGVTVESFTAQSVVMHRTDCTPYPGKAILTGQMSSDGNSIVNGVIRWTYHPCCGLSSGVFTAAWGAAINSVPGSDKERARMVQRQPQKAATTPATPGVTVDEARQNEICTSPDIRRAMQGVEDEAIRDPNGALLSLIGGMLTGVNARSNSVTVIDSKIGADGGRYTSKDPGSFVCRGLFARGEVHISENAGADGASDATAATMETIVKTHPTFIEWFKVKEMENGSCHVTLLPSSLQLSREYSAGFRCVR